MDQFIGILVFVLWMVYNIYSANQKSKAKKAENARKKPSNSGTPKTEKKGFREIMEEIRRAAEESRQEKQPKPVVVQQPEKVPVKRERMQTLSEREREKNKSYGNFVERQRKLEHDANQRHLEERILVVEEYAEKKRVKHQYDLRNIIISDAILNRPYK